jgi:hypothetical protein
MSKIIKSQDGEATNVEGGLTFGGGAAALSAYKEGTWSPSTDVAVNLGGTATYNTAKYAQVGRVVFASIQSISGLTITDATTSATQTNLTIDTSSLPSYGGTSYPMGGMAAINASVTGGAPIIALLSFTGGDSVNIILNNLSPDLNNGDSILIRSLHFWYHTDD